MISRLVRSTFVVFAFGLALLLSAPAWAQANRSPSSPAIIKTVNDYASVIAPTDLPSIDQHIAQARSKVQIAVLVVGTTNGVPIEDYANDAAVRWAGGTAGIDNGVLIVLAIDDHRSRIEVGRGLEPYLTDSRAKVILDGAKNPLRSSQYGAAVLGIVDEVATAAKAAPWNDTAAPGAMGAGTFKQRPPARAKSSSSGGGEVIAVFFVLFMLIGFIIVIVAIAKNSGRRASSGWNNGTYYGGDVSGPGWYSSGHGSSWSSSSYDSSSSSSYDSSSSSSYDSSSSSSYDSGSSSGGGGDFGGGGASSDW